MTPQQRRQLRRRVTRLGDRLSRNQERRAALQEVDDLDFRGRLKKIAEQAIAAGTLKDEDADGDIQFDDLVDFVVDWLDEKVEPANPILEWASSVGFEIAGWVAVAIYKNTEKRLVRRIAHDKVVMRRLKARLKEK